MTKAAAYRLLGLKPGATETEIKRQFKRLALKIHPDINPSPEANEQFIQLTLAVECLLTKNDTPSLSSQQRRPSRATSKANDPVSQEQVKARMDQAKKRFEQQRQQKQKEENRYYAFLTTGKRWAYFKTVIIIGCILSCCTLIDFILPYHYKKDELVSFSNTDYNGILFPRITAVQFKDAGYYYSEIERSLWINDYPEVKIASTWLLHTPVKFLHNDDFHEHVSYLDFHAGSISGLLIIVFLIPLITYFRKKKDLTFAFMYHISFWIVGILECYFLLSQQRLSHLITFGFL